MKTNHFELAATIIEISPMRYTPAGLAVTNCVLAHISQIDEADVLRTVELTVEALGMAEVAQQLSQCQIGEKKRCVGFLAMKHRKTKNIVFHITALKNIEED